MSDDLIRRIDAMQACQIGPSDEWSRMTKSGYSQAATDCAMGILKCESATPTLSAAMELPEVRALLEAMERIAHASDIYGVEANAEDQGAETLAYAHKSTCNLARAALAPFTEAKP